MRLFNIPHNDNNNSAISSTVYQPNLKYSLCFKRPRDHCGVRSRGVIRCLVVSSLGNSRSSSPAQL